MSYRDRLIFSYRTLRLFEKQKRPRWRTVKQPKDSSVCVAAVGAMAVGATLADFVTFIGRSGTEGFHDSELAAWLAAHGIRQAGIMFDKFHPAQAHGNGKAIAMEMDLHIANKPAYLSVVSERQTEVGHAVFWDGQHVRDPSPSFPARMPLTHYRILEWSPLQWSLQHIAELLEANGGIRDGG